jgi:protease-4
MAYANSYTQKEYYLNSVASPIYINPVGDMDFKGLSAELMFLKKKTGVKWRIRHGKYKSAVEPFLENEMSDANREQVTVLLNPFGIQLLLTFRKVETSQLTNEIANGLLARHQKWR